MPCCASASAPPSAPLHPNPAPATVARVPQSIPAAQVAARYRAYGEIVWFDIFEEEGAAWLSEAAAALERQREELGGLEARAAAVLAAAEGSALI